MIPKLKYKIIAQVLYQVITVMVMGVRAKMQPDKNSSQVYL